jgi:hypothetical protein
MREGRGAREGLSENLLEGGPLPCSPPARCAIRVIFNVLPLHRSVPRLCRPTFAARVPNFAGRVPNFAARVPSFAGRVWRGCAVRFLLPREGGH